MKIRHRKPELDHTLLSGLTGEEHTYQPWLVNEISI